MRRFMWFLILVLIIFTPNLRRGEASDSLQISRVTDLLEDMTPEERVGQLFIVTFEGNQIEKDNPIYTLIVDHHISGVLLDAQNDNYGEGPEALQDARNLISE